MAHFFLVDDDNVSNFLNTAIIKRVLPSADVQIHKSAEELLKHIQNGSISNSPDVMLLDIRMPGMSGFELLEELKTMQSNPFINTDIYMLSSTLDERDFERAKKCSFIKGFLEKPLTLTIIKDVLKSYIP